MKTNESKSQQASRASAVGEDNVGSYKTKVKKGVMTAIAGLAGLSAVAIGAGGSDRAQANVTSECYEVTSTDVPDMDIMTSELPRTDIWCYRELEERPGARLVYNVDAYGRTKAELSAVVDADGTITHASLAAGKLSVHRVRGDWNPTGIPLVPPMTAKRVPEPMGLVALENDHGPSAALRVLVDEESIARGEVFTAELKEGEFASQASYLPWRSFWFAHASGRLHRGEDSPMAKYDRFVQRRIGESPGAVAWERRKHAPRDVKWAGHCNGWSAASILRPEPAVPVTDPFTGITFGVADQKGLWIESDWCPKSVQFGRRTWSGNDGDVSPRDFHNAVTYYLGVIKKPMLMDLMANEVVENRVVSAYDMKVRKTGERTYKVTTTLTIHAYDKKPNELIGPAGVFKRTYRYTLSLDAEGKMTRGSWQSGHPDFLWVPMASDVCENRNPAIHEAWLDEIYRMSVRQPGKPTMPTAGMMPADFQPEPEDTRPLGSSPTAAATPPPAGSQPDEPGSGRDDDDSSHVPTPTPAPAPVPAPGTP